MKILIILIYTTYLFLLTGLFFHTSSSPEILGKYTQKYFFILIMLVILFPILLFFLRYISKSSIIKIRKRKIKLTPGKKIIISTILFLAFILFPADYFLRDKFENFESTNYQVKIENFHPFLQYQMTKETEGFKVNSDGFRGKEIVSKNEDTFRIVVFGGSTVLQRNLNDNQTTSFLLEKYLSKKYPDKNIEVINAGFDGYTTEHSLIQYLFKVKDMKPDLVIMWHGINDLYYSCTPSDRARGQYKSDYSHFYSADGRMVFNYFNTPQPIEIKLLTFDFFKKFIKDNLFSDFKDKYKSKHSDPEIYTNAKPTDQYEMKSPSRGAYGRNINSFIGLAKSADTFVIIGDQPNLYEKENSKKELEKIWMPKTFCSKEGKFPSLLSFKKAMDEFNFDAKKVSEENSVGFVELSKMPKNLDYFVDDVHYTKLGSDFIAKMLVNEIVKEGLLER